MSGSLCFLLCSMFFMLGISFGYIFKVRLSIFVEGNLNKANWDTEEDEEYEPLVIIEDDDLIEVEGILYIKPEVMIPWVVNILGCSVEDMEAIENNDFTYLLEYVDIFDDDEVVSTKSILKEDEYKDVMSNEHPHFSAVIFYLIFCKVWNSLHVNYSADIIVPAMCSDLPCKSDIIYECISECSE